MNLKLNGYVNIRDAFNHLGKKYFSKEWSGDEILVHDSLKDLVSSKYKAPKDIPGIMQSIHVKMEVLLVDRLEETKKNILLKLEGSEGGALPRGNLESFLEEILKDIQGFLFKKHPSPQVISSLLKIIVRYACIWTKLRYLFLNEKLTAILYGEDFEQEASINKSLWLSNQFTVDLGRSHGNIHSGGNGYIYIPEGEIKLFSKVITKTSTSELSDQSEKLDELELMKKTILSENARKAGKSRKSKELETQILEDYEKNKHNFKTKIAYARQKAENLIKSGSHRNYNLMKENLANRIAKWISSKTSSGSRN